MKRQLCIGLITGALMLVMAGPPQGAAVAGGSNIDRAVVSVEQPVRLLGVVLHGRYLFLHHNGMMQHGRPCMFIYTLDSPNEGARVLAYHCEAVVRPRALEFKLALRNIPGDMPEVTEVQFAGTSEGHKAPEVESAE